MENRWSDAARLAALAVRRARAFAPNPVKANAVAQPGGIAPKPMAPKPMAAKPAASDAGRNNPGPNIWIPPPNDPHWKDPAFVESFKSGVAEREKAGITPTKTMPPKIMPPKIMPPKRPPIKGGGEGVIETDTIRYIIGGKRYTKVGNKLVPDVIAPGEKVKNFYSK